MALIATTFKSPGWAKSSNYGYADPAISTNENYGAQQNCLRGLVRPRRGFSASLNHCLSHVPAVYVS